MKRRPWLACILSLFSIGLGQMYNGQLKKGLFFYFGAFCFSSVVLYTSVAVSQYRVLNLLLLIITVVPNITFAIEAGLSAKKNKIKFYNKKIQSMVFLSSIYFSCTIWIKYSSCWKFEEFCCKSI